MVADASWKKEMQLENDLVFSIGKGKKMQSVLDVSFEYIANELNELNNKTVERDKKLAKVTALDCSHF